MLRHKLLALRWIVLIGAVGLVQAYFGKGGGLYVIGLQSPFLYAATGLCVDVSNVTDEILFNYLHTLQALKLQTLHSFLPGEHHHHTPAVAVPIVVVPHTLAILSVPMLLIEGQCSLLVILVTSADTQPNGSPSQVIVVVGGFVERTSIGDRGGVEAKILGSKPGGEKADIMDW